jgi:hypothetical protein
MLDAIPGRGEMYSHESFLSDDMNEGMDRRSSSAALAWRQQSGRAHLSGAARGEVTSEREYSHQPFNALTSIGAQRRLGARR